MAIIIPSKSIYQLNNPKVRDNIIDKVFVDKTIVKPDNDYKVSVYNEDYTIENVITESDTQTEFVDATALNSGGTSIRNVRGVCGLYYKLEYFNTPEILIPKIKNNKLVNKLYDGIDDKGNSDIKISIKAKQQLYKGVIPYLPSVNLFSFNYSDMPLAEDKDLYGIQEFEIENDVTSKVSSMEVTQPYSKKSTHSIVLKNNVLKASSYLYVNSNNNWQPTTMTIDVNKTINTSVGNITVEDKTIDGVEYYKLPSMKVFVGGEIFTASCLLESTSDISSLAGQFFYSPATSLLLKSEQITITVYGNTIGISLSNTNGAYGTGSKPYTIGKNELIQDGGMSGGFNLASHLSALIRRQYENGKETATLTCSINDYYDSNGNLIVSPKSDQKMLFEIYDKVVPMVRQSYGVDAPMSLTSENYAKVFEVVGVRVYYDGAVWQELTLKEFNESANIQIQLPAPTIRIADDILYIQDGSGLGKSFQIYVDGNAQDITDSKTYPLSNLSSITQGSHNIYVVSLEYENYTSSGASNVVTYEKKVALTAPVISIIDSTLVINDTSGKAEQFAIYANGALLLYTKASANTINLDSYISQEGTYTITVSAYADGYTASAMSNEESFTRSKDVGGYLTFVGEDNEFTLGASKYWDGQVYISTDAQNWSEWYGDTVSSVDKKIYLRGKNNTTMRGSDTGAMRILALGGSATKVACYGNIANLLDYPKVYAGKTNEIAMADKCFYSLFYNQKRLTRCPELPFTTLSASCYFQMFKGCTNLATLPKLPATALEEYCYFYMFNGCTSIKLSTTKSDEYPNEYRIPTEGNTSNAPSFACFGMFENTGGTFVPEGNADILGITLYTPNEIV